MLVNFNMAADKTGKFILSLDIGTTSMRCFVYDKQTNIIGKYVLLLSSVNHAVESKETRTYKVDVN